MSEGGYAVDVCGAPVPPPPPPPSGIYRRVQPKPFRGDSRFKLRFYQFRALSRSAGAPVRKEVQGG